MIWLSLEGMVSLSINLPQKHSKWILKKELEQ